jgi:hypothetical protein
MLVLAVALLLVRVLMFFEHLDQGWLQALGFYPLTSSEALGYDAEKFAEYGLIVWVGYRLLRGSPRASSTEV